MRPARLCDCRPSRRRCARRPSAGLRPGHDRARSATIIDRHHTRSATPIASQRSPWQVPRSRPPAGTTSHLAYALNPHRPGARGAALRAPTAVSSVGWPSDARPPECEEWVRAWPASENLHKGGCRRQADRTADLPQFRKCPARPALTLGAKKRHSADSIRHNVMTARPIALRPRRRPRMAPRSPDRRCAGSTCRRDAPAWRGARLPRGRRSGHRRECRTSTW
jgi:hypothetical protein